MDHTPVLPALTAECRALSAALSALPAGAWERPTRCAPWSARELLAHVATALDRVPDMLDAPAPARAEVSAAGYYRPDARFSARANADRVASARARRPAHPAQDFDAARHRLERACADQPADRVVRTRHGDAMLLGDFLATRVVEVAVHGLDLADALDLPSWLTPAAADVVTGLLLGPDREASLHRLGWPVETFLRRATGRAPLGAADRARADELGVSWLALG